MTVKIIRYICCKCGNIYLYQNLIKRRTITINRKEVHYQHGCSNSECNGKDFRIVSVITN